MSEGNEPDPKDGGGGGGGNNFKLFDDLMANPSEHLNDDQFLNKTTREHSVGERGGHRSKHVSKLTPEGGPYETLDAKYDCCVFVIHCHKHDKVAVLKPKNQNLAWLPFTPLPPYK